MNKINARRNKALCLAIAMIIALALLPVAASAAGNTLNITPTDSEEIESQSNRFYFRDSEPPEVIFVNDSAPITIEGNGTNGYSGNGWAVSIQQATDITIKKGTIIKTNTTSPALSVPSNAMINGEGSDITIFNSNNPGIYFWGGGGGEISGTIGDVTGGKGDGIFSDGSVVISGSVGNVSGDGDGNAGINSAGSVEISGSVGNVTGSGANAAGIYSPNGSVTISGTIGDVTGGDLGIYSSGGVTISGTIGDVYGGRFGIYSTSGSATISGKVGDVSGGATGIFSLNGGVTISGTVGNVTGGGSGISSSGSVIISGKVDSITGGDLYQIEAQSYAVLDYTDGDGLLNPVICFPQIARIVTFEYVPSRPGGVSLKKAYITNGQKIPVPTVPGVPKVWYVDSGLTTPWNFNTGVTTDDIVLYARAEPDEPGSGGGCNGGAGALGILALALALRAKRKAKTAG